MLFFTNTYVVYQHKAVKEIEFMIVDALEEANDHIFFSGPRTEIFPEGKYKISEAIHAPEVL